MGDSNGGTEGKGGVWEGCTLPSLGPRKLSEIVYANLCILVLFGNICLGQQCPAKILDWQKDTPARAVFLMGGGRWAWGHGPLPSDTTDSDIQAKYR